MYQKGNYYRNKRYYTNKGLTYQKKPQDPPKIIDPYYVPIYRNYFIKTRELIPYTPGVSFIQFKKRNDTSKTIGDFILEEVLAYGKNLTDISKIEIEPEVDITVSYTTIYTKVTIVDNSVDINVPNEYGIWSVVTTNNSSNIIVTNNTSYTFTSIEGGWNIEMSPGVNEITTNSEISQSESNINSTGNVSEYSYAASRDSPIKNEYKGYTRDTEDNILALKFVSTVVTNKYYYAMLQVKVYF